MIHLESNGKALYGPFSNLSECVDFAKLKEHTQRATYKKVDNGKWHVVVKFRHAHFGNKMVSNWERVYEFVKPFDTKDIYLRDVGSWNIRK